MKKKTTVFDRIPSKDVMNQESVDRNGVKRFPKIVSLHMDEPEYRINRNKRVTTCILYGAIEYNIPLYWQSFLTTNELNTDSIIRAVGVAKCSPDDHFDSKKGIEIAKAKAENIIFKEFSRRLSIIKRENERMNTALTRSIERFDNCYQHNVEYMDKVVSSK